MFLTALPNINSYDDKEVRLKENVIILATTNNKYSYPRHRTPYLFVTNFLNKGNYVLNKKHIEISDRQFYFLNANDDLEINFQKKIPLQTLLILFEKNFIEDCFNYLGLPNEELPNVPFAHNGITRQKITRLAQRSLQKDEVDNLLFELIVEFSLLNRDTSRQIKKIKAVKRSTQEELYKRLFLAKELINANVCENLTLEQIAKETCLNKFHLLSNFKTVFNTTPHQYHIELKLQKAFQLLQSKQYSVTEVCLFVGFEAIGSFSNLFKKRFGISPSGLFREA